MSIYTLQRVANIMDTRAEIKYLLFKEHSSITKLAIEMSHLTGKEYTMRSLSQKLLRGTLRADEYKLILNILGYSVKLVKNITDKEEK